MPRPQKPEARTTGDTTGASDNLRLNGIESRLLAVEHRGAVISKAVLTLIRAVFPYSRGHWVNAWERELSPQEMLDFEDEMKTHGMPPAPRPHGST